jgi:putative membrane protein
MASYLEIAPTINAILNGMAAVLLVTGRVLISRRRIEDHKRAMIAAFATSSVFLVNYLAYHSLIRGSHHFTGRGWIRPVYFIILLTHTVLAAAIVPLVLMSLSRGLKRQDARHRAISRWTFPLWLYVSVTGVIIYLLLYRVIWS